MAKTEYQRNLPHFQPLGEKFFITFRLYDSFFNKLILQIIEKKNEKIKSLLKTKPANYQALIKLEKKQVLVSMDKLLDDKYKSTDYLLNEKVAEIVRNKLHEYDEKLYRLIAYTIMPNHVHLAIDTSIQLQNVAEDYFADNYIQIDKIMKYIKGGSAFEANKILNRKGQFWHHESYDHVIANDKELINIINYILQNPVKARLVEDWKNWKFSYVNEAYL